MAARIDFDPSMTGEPDHGLLAASGASSGPQGAPDALPADAAGTPAEPPADNETPAARDVVAVEDGAILRLPEGASIDSPRVNGADLEFVQPDGSVIVVPDGALTGLTIFIGDVEIPPQTVAALFEASGIETAAGPATEGPASSGGNFAIPPGGIGPALPYGPLLPPTELGFGQLDELPRYEGLLEDSETPENGLPGQMAAEAAAIVEDEALAGGIDEDDAVPDYAATASGDVSDNGAWGADGFGRITKVAVGANAAVAVPEGGSVTVYFDQAGAYLGTDATGAAASLVVDSAGTYSFTLLANLLIEGAGEQLDSIGEVLFTGVDGDGDEATIALTLQHKDDVPGSMAAETAAIVEDEALAGGIDEDDDAVPDYAATASGDVSDNGAWGADGFYRITKVAIGANAALAVPEGGSVTVYFDQAGAYLGTDATGAAASLVVDSAGTYSFTLLANLLIEGAGEQLDSIGEVLFTGVDGDGDEATIALTLQHKDDVPGQMAAEAAAPTAPLPPAACGSLAGTISMASRKPSPRMARP